MNLHTVIGACSRCGLALPACVCRTKALDTAAATAAANAQGVGFKADSGKPDYALLPWGPLEDVVYVLTLGAQKYAADNWQKVPNAERRYLSAAFRHLVARAKGEVLDPETGKPHLAHAVCCLLFLAWFDRRGA
jgi:hypothetical protein